MSRVAPNPAPRGPILDLGQMPDDALVDRGPVAAFSGFAVATLKKWAAENRGPRITRVEGRPRYRVRDVREWAAGLQNPR